MGRLDGKVALVTGGAGSIGLATARRFIADGASVVIADRNEAQLDELAAALSERGGRALGIAVDVTSQASVAALVEQTTDALGRIDILFTCAGVLVAGSVMETSLADWQRTLAVNLTGPFLASRSVVPVMIANGGGSIVHMS